MRVRLAHLDQARREFIGNASHELRTPLFALGGFLELLADEDLDEATRRDFLETARGQVDRLTRTRNRSARPLEAGCRQARVRLGAGRPASPAHHSARGGVRSTCRGDGHELSVADGAAAVGLGDGERCCESVARSSRTRFATRLRVRRWSYARRSGRSRATLRARRRPRYRSGDQERVFERFYRGDGSAPEGSGIGLAIARELAQRMGGTIELARSRARRRSPSRSHEPPSQRFHVKTSWCSSRERRATAAYRPARGSCRARGRRRWRRGSRDRRSGRWVGSGETVVLPQPGAPAALVASPPETQPEPASEPPQAQGAFDPAALYRDRAPGVVTIYARYPNHAGTEVDTEGQGSGFVVSPDGYILTNSHVITTAGGGDVVADAVEPATEVYVEFADGDRVGAEIVGWDLFYDVGLLKVSPAEHALVAVPLGDSADVVVGEPVAAIGSPFGQAGSLAVGVVSATRRSVESLTSGSASSTPSRSTRRSTGGTRAGRSSTRSARSSASTRRSAASRETPKASALRFRSTSPAARWRS